MKKTKKSVEIGTRLREIRGAVSQTTAANMVGVTQGTWAKYESGMHVPSDDVKCRISEITGLTVQQIFYDDEWKGGDHADNRNA